MRLKNRIIWGITFTSSTEEKTPYINFGEGRFAYISWSDFCNILLPTAKVKSGSKTLTLKEAIKYSIPTDFRADFDAEPFLKHYFSTFVACKDKLVIFKDFSYRIEDDLWVKHCDGKMQYFVVKHFKNHQIQFNQNGCNGYSIWKNKVCLENNIWSIKRCKEIIEEIK